MYFIRLIRPVNLAVIALTMYAVRVFFLPYLGMVDAQLQLLKYRNIPEEVTIHYSQDWVYMLSHESIDYFLLVLSTVMIAAAGNIINDYFDVKSDRINRPEKLIITKYIKPRWAILWHWVLNFVAFSIACYLSWRYETFVYVFVHLFSINALWFYSMYFKRKFLSGNLLIAFLTALVTILSGLHFLQVTPFAFHTTNIGGWIISGDSFGGSSFNLPIFFIVTFAAFAFALNLVREIVKDVEDMEGDKMLRAKTMPLVLGVAKTRWICVVLMTAILIVSAPFIIEGYNLFPQSFLRFMSPALVIAALLLFGIVQLFLSTDRSAMKRVDFTIKLAMIIGCCMPFYWFFL